MRCIFCLKERAPTIEHVFPDAIGGTLTITRVCDPCNSWLGTNVDAYLTGHIGVLMKRFLLRIPNRDGKTTGLDDILGLGVLANDPEQRIKLVRGRGTDQITPQLLYRSQRIQSEDGKETVRITVDERQAADLGKIIEGTLRREGHPPLSQAELQAKIAELKEQMRTLEQPCVRHALKVDLIEYHNAILKIAYEFAWLWLGDAYLEDPVAVKLRRKILENADEQIGGVIQIGTTTPFDTMWTDEPNALLSLGQISGGVVAISVRIFDVLCGLVVVSEKSARYPGFREGRFFCCDPQTKETRNTTLPEEVIRVIRSRRAAGLDAAPRESSP
jgi:HNH endonuclease